MIVLKELNLHSTLATLELFFGTPSVFIKITPPGLSDFTEGFQGLTSLSHTNAIEVRVGCGSQALDGIGVDVELSNRKVRPDLTQKVYDRIVQKKERGWGLSLIEHWVIKEACFKANPANLGTTLPEYIVESYDACSGQGVVGYRDESLHFLLGGYKEYTLAFAFHRAH